MNARSSIVSILMVTMVFLSIAVTPWQEMPASAEEPRPIAAAASTNTGLLLEPPLDLDWLTRDKFLEMSFTVGREKVGKEWTSPVTKLPEHERADVHGLTEAEVKSYMQLAKQWFDEGRSIPVSDVGLISTQEDVIRQPMLNHIAAFSNSVARVYLLVQKTASDQGWSYFSIVQDMTIDPPLDYFGHIKPTEVRLEATSCYKCHTSGPLAIHPAREDLVLDARLAAALSEYIAQQPRSRMHFPAHDPAGEYGQPMTLEFCASCHAEDGERGPLFKQNSHPIRVMVDFGYMPPDRRLTPEEIAELAKWLNTKP